MTSSHSARVVGPSSRRTAAVLPWLGAGTNMEFCARIAARASSRLIGALVLIRLSLLRVTIMWALALATVRLPPGGGLMPILPWIIIDHRSSVHALESPN